MDLVSDTSTIPRPPDAVAGPIRAADRPRRDGPLRVAAMAGLALALAAVGSLVLPRGLEGAALLRAADDPARLSELRLAPLATPERITHEIDAALAGGDADLGQSFLALAEARGLAIDAERRQRVEALAGSEAGPNATQGWLETTGTVAADLVGVSDIRDLWREGGKLAQGVPYDGVMLGLSAAGLALTGLTLAALLPSAGTSAVARIPAARGLALLKSARRAGLLSRPLLDRLGGLTLATLDRAALAETIAATRALDLTAARATLRNVLRPDALRTLSTLGGDLAAIEGRLGQRGAVQALGVARDAAEVGRIRRLATALGARTRATLTLLGSAALLLGDVAALLLQAVWLALGWMFASALFARRLGLMLGRAIWRKPATGRHHRRPPAQAVPADRPTGSGGTSHDRPSPGGS